MGLGDLFRRLSKGAGEPKLEGPAPGRMKGGKFMPPIPKYLKKDKFLRDAEAAVAAALPASEPVAETGSFKKPGAWLKSRLGGIVDSKAPKNIEKTTQALRRTGAFNDAEIDSFLSGLLDVVGVEEESPNPPPPAKGP